jgi:ER lumen protein retaining receptor
MYRGLYLLNWIYRWMTEPYYFQPIVWVSGMVQTGLYADFFYYYIRSRMNGDSKMKLPTTQTDN